jgi:hypothetical protein
MRLLLVTNDYPPKPGGIQQYLGGLVAALEAEVRVLAPRHPGAVAEPHVFRGHRRFLWPTRHTQRWIARHVTEFEPDAILFGAPHPLAHLGPRLRRDTGVGYGVLCHGAEIVLPAAFPLLRTLVRYPLRRADVLFATSAYTAGRVTLRRPPASGGVEPHFVPVPPGSRCASPVVPGSGWSRRGGGIASRGPTSRAAGGTGATRSAALPRHLGVPTDSRSRSPTALPISSGDHVCAAVAWFAEAEARIVPKRLHRVAGDHRGLAGRPKRSSGQDGFVVDGTRHGGGAAPALDDPFAPAPWVLPGGNGYSGSIHGTVAGRIVVGLEAIAADEHRDEHS